MGNYLNNLGIVQAGYEDVEMGNCLNNLGIVQAGYEDVEMGNCLNNLGIPIADSKLKVFFLHNQNFSSPSPKIIHFQFINICFMYKCRKNVIFFWMAAQL